MTVGQRIKARIDSLEITQRQLANKLNISPSTLNGYITDYRKPDTETIKRLALILHTTSDYLLGLDITNDYTDVIDNQTLTTNPILSEEEKDFSTVGERLKKCRTAKGISSKKLAKLFGIFPERYNQYENGYKLPEHYMLEKFANYFDVTIDYFLDGISFEDGEDSEEDSKPFHSIWLRDNVMYRLEELRLSKRMTRKQLGKKFKVTELIVSQWEGGYLEPGAKTTVALAEYFGVSIDYLVGRSNYPQTVEDTLKNDPTILGKLIDDKTFDMILNSLKQLDDFRRKWVK